LEATFPSSAGAEAATAVLIAITTQIADYVAPA
jgi:hypothetical protein